MKIIKKAGICFLSVLMVLSLFLSGHPGRIKIKDVKAKEGTAHVSLARIMYRNGISILDRPAKEGLWKISAGGIGTFCLNSGQSMCNGDTVRYRTHNAVTYKRQDIAKALTYYYWDSSKTTRAFALTQAYIWACGAGVDEQTTVYQAGKNLDSGYSNKDARAFCKKISETDPKGTIYYYTVTHCVKAKKHDKHQMLYRMTKDEESPEKDSVTYSDSMRTTEDISVKIRKRDQSTGVVLSGATFEFFRDGKSVGKATTNAKGIASFTYTETIKTETQKVTKKYIKNWKELSKDQQKEYTKQGYYDNKANATKAAKEEVKDLLNKIIDEKKSKTHTWKAKEIKAAPRHKINQTPVTKKEGSKDTTVNFGDFRDGETRINLEINKRSIISDFGVDATYANAEYGVYAKADILGPDNKTVAYKKDSRVTTIVTDATGYGCAKGLLVGEYYLKEEKAPDGFEKNEAPTDVTLDQNKKITVDETPIMGQIRLHKTYDDDQKNEAGAVFEVYNSKDQLVDKITTGNDGLAVTKELPYGSYRLHQTKGTAGFSAVPDLTAKIDGTTTTYEVRANNPREAARISLSKTISIKDTQTGTNQKAPEYGARFQIIRKSDQKVLETLTTDQNGYAASRALDPGIYTVHQIKGTDNYAFVSDFDVTLKDGDHSDHTYTLDNPWEGKKLMIKKTMQKNGREEIEAAAEFTVLDATKAGDYNKADLGSEESRKAYIASLTKDAVIGRLTTDAKGTASMILKDLPSTHDFLVIQTKGEEGYDLAPVYDSRDYKAEVVDGMKVYQFTAKDNYSAAASIRIEKQKKISDVKTAPEAGAVFELCDLDGNVITTLTTAEDGTAIAHGIALGTYILHQTKGSKQHELIEDQTIVLSKKDKGQTIRYRYDDSENPIDFVLVKRSKETKKLLNDAVYVIYDDAGEKVATLSTGSMKDGCATCKLPYGHYTIKEINAPDGYNKNETGRDFTLDLESVTYDADGNGTYIYQDTDEPVYGVITLKKTGETLSGYDNGFVYENDQISGAVYGLYAREDVKKDDGSVVWKAGTLIDQKTTTKNGVVKFTRKDGDGKETDQFYQGSYYVKEIKGPHGYCIDKEEHDVVIHWDTKPGQMNQIRDTEDVSGNREPQGNNGPYPSSGIYVLETGEALNEKLKDAKTIVFTWEDAPEGVSITDVSQDQDESVALWKEGTTTYISSQKAGQVIYMNAVSGGMFADCKELTSVLFKNIDTSGVADMSRMFSNCQKLKELDLSSFNMSSVGDVRKMFYGCGKLKTTYVQDQIIKAEDDYKDPKVTSITAVAKTDFMLGDTYHAKDFAFSAAYDDDGSQALTGITDEDVSFSPETADYAGKRKVMITFKDSGKYKGYDPIEVTVNVIDPDQGDVSLDTARQIDINLELNDLLQKYTIHFIKTDQNGNHLRGATFALKAACEIVDKNGKTLFSKGDTISTAVSGDDQFGYLEFFGLPTDLYAKDGNGSKMYTVEEISPPDGYVPTKKTLTFSGSIPNDQTENLIHDVASEGNVNNDENTYLHDSDVIENEHTDYITVKKYWIDDNNAAKKRPTTLTITATNKKTHEVKTYVLNEANGWQMQTDIRQEDKEMYEFREELNTPGYQRVGDDPGGAWDSQTYVVSFVNQRNQEEYVDVHVKKVWDDANNADGIRPALVKVILYQNDKEINSKTLNEGNNWSTSFEGLKKEDATGNRYNYEVKEEATDAINDDSKTGYEITYDVTESNDSEGNTDIQTNITNTHTPKTTQKSIEKIWDDEDDKDGIRPASVKFHLMDGDTVADTVTLSQTNGWKETSRILPKYKNGTEINYTWEEVKEGVITGENQIGYQVRYDKEENDPDRTIATNEHTPGKGSITIYKELDPTDLTMNIGDAIFSFTLTGIDVYGKFHTYKKEIEFTKEEVEAMIKDHPEEKIRLSEIFEDLPYGTYICKESGMEQYFQLKSLTTTSSNASVSQDGKSVTFKIGPEGSSGSAKMTGEATFINQMIKGRILLKKKDGNGKALEGVSFMIEDSNGNEIMTRKTDSKGEATFEGLLPDTYVITETKTTPGHSLLKEPIRVSFPMILTQTEVDQKHADTTNAILKDGKYYFYELTYEVDNDSRLELPSTGGFDSMKTYFPLIGGIGAIMCGCYLAYQRKKEQSKRG